MTKAFVVVLGFVMLLACEKPPPTGAPAGSNAAHRTCHLMGWNPKKRFVRLELESGVAVDVLNTTACVVLDERATRTLVRITEGAHNGMTGWVSSDAVTK